MDMDSSRRSFDRSREQGIKKPRLSDELELGSNTSVRPFPQRQVASGVNTLASARFRTNDRDLESSDSGRGGYQPQPLQQELVTQYKTALAELTFNSKPIITNLTIIAGENLYAAKAIAATVCANIIEVPTEQKLPSLYLLDSIVKNIGRDYIKYFAARLPEVFCKAYRQVDPSVHSSMRHLFGTWKGVFPLQTLQMIEKELGFAPAVNGSSSTIRSDSQSQRPQHSIHVNPKYLERQRLQQSSRSKGIANDMAGAIANSTDSAERSDRTLGAARAWVDSSVNLQNIQRTNRDAYNDSVPDKGIGASYGGNEYGSDLSRNSGLGIGRAGGRVSELVGDKAWYKGGSGAAEMLSGQRNGFGLKGGLSALEAPKSLNLDEHNQSTQNITSIKSDVLSSSWKNSEEEEYMWDEMNTGLTDCGASSVSNSLRKGQWTADDDNMAVEHHHQITHHFGAKVDREVSSEKKQPPAIGHRPSLSWKLQEQPSFDELSRKPCPSEGFASSTIGGLANSANSSSVRMGNRPFLSNATIGSAGVVRERQFHSVGEESPSRQSQSPSPPVNVNRAHQFRNLAEQDHPLKMSQFSGGLQNQDIHDSSPVLPHIAQVGNSRRSQQKDFQGPLSSVSTFPPRQRYAASQQHQVGSSQTEVSGMTEKPPQSRFSLTGETSEQPTTTSSLLAAVMKSGILSNNSITSSQSTSVVEKRNLPSKSGVPPSRQSGSSPTKSISSGPGVASPSPLVPSPNDDSSSLPKVTRGKVGEQPRVPALPPPSSTVGSASAKNANNNSPNPVSNLLSSLVAKGLISAKTESSTKVPDEMLIRLKDQNQSITTSSSFPVSSISGSSAIPVLSTRDDLPAKPSGQSTTPEIRNLIGFEFKPNVIRELHLPVIRELIDDFPLSCSICGLRLKHQEQLNRHLEWHATRDRETDDPIKASRKWYLKSSDWIVGYEVSSECEYMDSVESHGKESDESEVNAMVPSDEDQCLCALCGELFEDVYCQEREEWMFKGAVYISISDSDGELLINVSTARGPIVHEKCLSESSMSIASAKEQD